MIDRKRVTNDHGAWQQRRSGYSLGCGQMLGSLRRRGSVEPGVYSAAERGGKVGDLHVLVPAVMLHYNLPLPPISV